ncbi:MAG: hypothetical protein EXS55_00710 [Candidatus Magasanikbacteria bacterium]|nr:hypothetical protein [Candidatus Magasanikbacteria bacterium]
MSLSKWYQRWWGVVLISLAAFVVIIALVVGGFTGWYWWQIRHGNGAWLSNKFVDNFTSSLSRNTVKAGAIDRVALELPTAPALGRPGAPITIVEFVDFKCPNCRAAAPIMEALLAKHGYTVRLIIRHIPVESTHPGATRLAELAVCAARQDKFWPVHDLLYASQDTVSDTLTPQEISDFAKQANLNEIKIESCLNSPEAKRVVKADYFDALRFGVRGTPTFFVNGEKVEGVVPMNVWEEYLKNILPEK